MIIQVLQQPVDAHWNCRAMMQDQNLLHLLSRGVWPPDFRRRYFHLM